MTRSELDKLLDKTVRVTFYDGTEATGTLGFVKDFSAKYDYRKPNYYYIGHTSFKVSYIKKLQVM